MTRKEILDGVRFALAEVLDADPAAIDLKARVIDDLGADSLDLLDLVFRLEKRFGVKFKPGEIERRARERLGGVPLEVDGVYTPEALRQLREFLTEVPPEEIAEGLGPSTLPRLLRAETFANLVTILLAEQAGPAEGGG